MGEILKLSQDPVSLQAPIGEEGDSELGHFIEDDTAPAPPEAADEALMRDELRAVLNRLPEREVA